MSIQYVMYIVILIGIYVILSDSLNLVAGYTGLFSIAQAAFYGVGAYVAALMALGWHTPFLVNLPCAVVLSAVLGAVVGTPGLRIRDDYFVIATFAFQVIAFSILNNWVSFTGGPMGLPGIPQPVIFGWEVSSHWEFLILVGCFAALTVWISWMIVESPFGRVLKAIREDEVFAQAAGKNVAAYKVLIFAISAGLAAIAGVMYAHYISFIDPTSFTVMESIFIISIVIIGGAGSLWGPVVGAVVLVTLPEILRFIGLPNAVAANLRQIIYGGLLVAFMMWRPQGFIGEFSFEKKGSAT
jgi:branched-chain amino acid transport system permease protein